MLGLLQNQLCNAIAKGNQWFRVQWVLKETKRRREGGKGGEEEEGEGGERKTHSGSPLDPAAQRHSEGKLMVPCTVQGLGCGCGEEKGEPVLPCTVGSKIKLEGSGGRGAKNKQTGNLGKRRWEEGETNPPSLHQPPQNPQSPSLGPRDQFTGGRSSSLVISAVPPGVTQAATPSVRFFITEAVFNGRWHSDLWPRCCPSKKYQHLRLSQSTRHRD